MSIVSDVTSVGVFFILLWYTLTGYWADITPRRPATSIHSTGARDTDDSAASSSATCPPQRWDGPSPTGTPLRESLPYWDPRLEASERLGFLPRLDPFGSNASSASVTCANQKPPACKLPACASDPISGRCVPNTIDWATKKKGAPNELRCVNRPKSSLPQGDDPISEWKRATAKPFGTWVDWDATCSTEPLAHGGEMRAYHDEELDYVMENVCIPSEGPLRGYKPNARPFGGLDETYFMKRIPKETPYLSKIDPMPAAPTCVVDTPVVLVLLKKNSENSVHMAARIRSALALKRFRYWQKGDPVWEATEAPSFEEQYEFDTKGVQSDRWKQRVVRQHQKKANDAKQQRGYFGTETMERYAYKERAPPGKPIVFGYLRLAGGSWEGVRYHYPALSDAWFGSEEEYLTATTTTNPSAENSTTNASETEAPVVVPSAPAMCFRKVFVSYTCFKTSCALSLADLPGRRYHMGFYRDRTRIDAMFHPWIRRLYAECVYGKGYAFRTEANRMNPLVVIGYRTGKRVIADQSSFLLSLARGLMSDPQRWNASGVIAVENGRLLPHDSIKLLLNADVYIAPFGAGNGWVFLLPPGGSFVELGTIDHGCPRRTPYEGMYYMVGCEYSGDAVMSNVRYYLAMTSLYQQREAIYFAPEPAWWFFMERAFCMLRWTPQEGSTTMERASSMTPTPLLEAPPSPQEDAHQERNDINGSSTATQLRRQPTFGGAAGGVKAVEWIDPVANVLYSDHHVIAAFSGLVAKCQKPPSWRRWSRRPGG